MIKKVIKIILIIFISIIVIIQFFRPERFHTDEVTADDITKKINVPDNVQEILKHSCFDCHSNHTDWPWYTNFAPVSWVIADDVKKGRAKMNFSEWGKLSPTKQGLRLENICEQISEGEMPLPKYLILHPDKVLSDADKDILCKWSKEEKEKMENE